VLVERPVFPALEDLSQVGESLLNQPEEEGSKRVKKADMRKTDSRSVKSITYKRIE